ncbi:MAG: TldD/PmbA family protein [Methanohalobium sp.]|uniref:TldD/PmbA family protein n=1 Tax=Methanohalobium sp. TaxID=2837493 RepID=UPI0039787CA8
MYDMARKAIKLAEKQGAEEAEVYVLDNHSTSADIRKNVVDSSNENYTKGIGIRAIINGAVGFASTNMYDRLEDTVKIAISSARVREKDPVWKSLPSNSQYPTISGTFDKKLVQMELEDCIDLTTHMIEGVTSVPDVMATSGSFSRFHDNRLIMNTNGIETEEEGTGVTGFIDVITTSEDKATAYDFKISRNLDINFYEIGINAASLAQQSQKGISIEPQKTDIILHPFAFADVLENTFASAINADNVQKGRSSLKGHMGDDIATPELSIIDDGTFDGGIETALTDDEGMPSQQTTVIDRGVFKSYLYDSYRAGKDNVESTGNATRQSYTNTPGIGLRNFIINYPQSDIISDTDDGVYINTVIGAHTANSISGDFSVEARNAFTIKNGEIDKPIKSLMISCNVFDMLKNITGAGDDLRSVGGFITPSIKITDMNVIG